MRLVYKRLILVFTFLILVLCFFEKGTFIKREKIKWDDNHPLTFKNFKGYRNYLINYDAEIKTGIEYVIHDDTLNSIEVNAFAYSHLSWVKNGSIHSDKLLNHEKYHFNLTEIIARKIRKAIIELPKDKITKKAIENICNNYINELNIIQFKYDDLTDHSLLIEKQKDWEYIIDSTLNAYEYYKKPLVSLSKLHESKGIYFREIEIGNHYKIEGRIPITDLNDTVAADYYKFYYNKNNDVVKVEYKSRGVNAKDKYYGVYKIEIAQKDSDVIWRFYDPNLNKTSTNKGVYSYKIRYDLSNARIVRYNLDSIDRVIENKDGFVKIVWELDSNNRISIGRMYDLKGAVVIDNDGFCFISYKYDSLNNIIEDANYDLNGNLLETKDGFAWRRYVLDEFGNAKEIRLYGKDNLLKVDKRGIAILRYNYDLNGNITRCSYYDKDGNIYINDDGVAISYYKYDKYSNQIEESSYGVNKNLKISNGKNGKTLSKFDLKRNVIEISNFDAYGDFLNNSDGIAKVNYSYNNYCKLDIENQYFVNAEKQLKKIKRIKYEYDSFKNMVSEKYINDKGHLKADSDGIALIKFKYDENRNNIEVRYYNEKQVLIPVSYGIAIFRYKYDKYRNKIETSYFDTNDCLKGTVYNIAKDEYKYDKNHRRIERRNIDTEGNLVKNGQGIKAYRWSYNEKGLLIRESYYDEKNNLAPNNQGVSEIEYKLDEYDNVIEEKYLDNHKKIVSNNDSVAIIRSQFDKFNRETKVSYFNIYDELVNCKEGYAIEQIVYNNTNKVIKKSYFSSNGNPIITSSGFSVIEWIYDSNENIIGQLTRDEANKLILDKDGVAIYNWIYNRNGDIVKVDKFGADELNLFKINKGPFYNTTISFNFNDNGNTDKTRIVTIYYKSGQKESETPYVDGKLEGIYKSWYLSGELESEIEYKNGERNGRTTEYYKNGRKKSEYFYKNNNISSENQTRWDENGNLINDSL